MALTYAPAADQSVTCPSFTLKDVVTNQMVQGPTTHHRATLVAFICAHCPYVRAIEVRLVKLASEFAPRGLGTFAICSNDPSEYPEDAPAGLAARATELGFTFPYLTDADQSVARAFGAVCTPDFFLFGPDRRLAYRGRLDDSWRDENKVNRRELADAVSAVLNGHPPALDSIPSMGCSIKWRD